MVLVFNLIPALPLDGGRVLRAVLWARQGDFLGATRTAAAIGRGFGQVLIALGVLSVLVGGTIGGLWLVFIGWFLLGAADAERVGAETHEALSGIRVRDVMVASPVSVDPDLPLDRFMEDDFFPNRYVAYPVLEDGRPVGLISFRSVLALARTRWPRRRVRDVMAPLDRLPTLSPDEPLETAVEQLSHDGVEPEPRPQRRPARRAPLDHRCGPRDRGRASPVRAGSAGYGGSSLVTTPDPAPPPATPPPGATPPPPATPPPARPGSSWTGGRVVGLIFISIAGLVGVALLLGGLALLGAQAFARDSDGFFTSSDKRLQSPGFAISTGQIDLGIDPASWAPNDVLGTLRIRAESTGARPLFLGIARNRDVNRYLARVGHTELTGFSHGDPRYEQHHGRAPPKRPGAEDFWVARSQGPGEREVSWDVQSGTWSIVVMNATGARGVSVEASAGVKLDWLVWVGVGLAVVGLILTLATVLLAMAVSRRAERDRRAAG